MSYFGSLSSNMTKKCGKVVSEFVIQYGGQDCGCKVLKIVI